MNQSLLAYFFVNASKHRTLVRFVYIVLLLCTIHVHYIVIHLKLEKEEPMRVIQPCDADPVTHYIDMHNELNNSSYTYKSLLLLLLFLLSLGLKSCCAIDSQAVSPCSWITN